MDKGRNALLNFRSGRKMIKKQLLIICYLSFYLLIFRRNIQLSVQPQLDLVVVVVLDDNVEGLLVHVGRNIHNHRLAGLQLIETKGCMCPRMQIIPNLHGETTIHLIGRICDGRFEMLVGFVPRVGGDLKRSVRESQGGTGGYTRLIFSRFFRFSNLFRLFGRPNPNWHLYLNGGESYSVAFANNFDVEPDFLAEFISRTLG